MLLVSETWFSIVRGLQMILGTKGMIGKVIWFNREKGYGFIERSEGPDVFVHYTAIVGEGYRNLNQGDVVEFELVQGAYGANVVTIQTSPHPEASPAGEIRTHSPKSLGRIAAQSVAA